MKVKLMDYKGKKTEFEIGNLEDVFVANMEVISGDEVLTVTYKDKTLKVFDSSDNRAMNFFDDSYVVYMPGLNLLENERWLKRKTSYDDKWRNRYA